MVVWQQCRVGNRLVEATEPGQRVGPQMRSEGVQPLLAIHVMRLVEISQCCGVIAQGAMDFTPCDEAQELRLHPYRDRAVLESFDISAHLFQ